MRSLLPRSLILIGAAVCPSAPLSAQDEDTQFWVYAVAKTDLSDDFGLTVDATARWREQRRGDEQQTLRFTVLKDVTKGVRLGGGGGVFETEGGRTEIRPHQEIDLKFGRFSARTRLEQRFFDGAERMEVRFRQLARYTLPLSQKTHLSVDGEYLGLMQRRNRGSNAPRDQWRARTIFTADVAKNLSLGAGYMMIYSPRPRTPDRINHVPEAYLTWRF